MRSEMPCTMSRLCSIRQMVMPSLRRLAHQLHEAVVGGRIEAGGRLVEQPERGVGDQDAREREEFLLRIAEIDRARVAPCGEADHARASRRPCRAARARPRAPPGCQGSAERSITLSTFSNTVICSNSRRSWNERAMPRSAALRGSMPASDLPAQLDLAGVRLEVAGDEVEQRGLAGAVRADQRGDDAGRQIEIDVVRRDHAAEALVDALEAQDGRRWRVISTTCP